MIVTMEHTIKITPQVLADLSAARDLVIERMPTEAEVVEHADHLMVTITMEIDC